MLESKMSRTVRFVKYGLPFVVIVFVVLLLYLKLFTTIMEVKVKPLLLSSDLVLLRKDGVTNNLSVVNLDSINTDQLLLTMHSYLDNIEVICQRKIRMGNVGDGGWEICDDPRVRPKNPCIVYSFGINYDFSFDDDVARLYGCHVYSFDPSMDKMETSNRSNRVHFYKIGISGQTITGEHGWNLYTLSDIRSRLGHQNAVIDVIKMDIEASEWDALPQMVSSGQLENVRQLLLEYHVTDTSYEYLLSRLKIIQAIERLGFKKFLVHKNERCVELFVQYPVPRTHCYEVHYLRGGFVTTMTFIVMLLVVEAKAPRMQLDWYKFCQY